MKSIFDNLVALVNKTPEKFFMNVSEYENTRIAMFDYSLTIPSDFNGLYAFECRGSLFEVDQDNNYVRTLVLPFEKFFNIHEYDFANNEGLYSTVSSTYGVNVNSSRDLLALPIKNVMVKEDGSIIAAYELHGELFCKSNSSCTSDYARKGESFLMNNKELRQRTKELTDNDFVVLFELKIKDLPIVIQHQKDDMVVLAVRSRLTGEYLTHDEVVEHFGEEYVVRVENHTSDELLALQKTLENTEGFVVLTHCGLRYKVKTEWYVERHRTVSHLFATPRNVWEMYVNGLLDDCYALFVNDSYTKERIDNAVKMCDDLYMKLVHDGVELYEQIGHLERKDFFAHLHSTRNEDKGGCVGFLAEMLYKGMNKEEATIRLKEKLLKKSTVADLGIMRWNV